MKLFYTDHFELPLPPGHRFPMSKYRLLRNRIVDQMATRPLLLVPSAVTRDQLVLAHDEDYVERVMAGHLSDTEVKRIGFPWSPAMVERSCRSSGATLNAARVAAIEGVSINLAGGTHHAMRCAGEGYCVFNDAAVTIRTLQNEAVIHRALIVDCDVHQGNGTAEIFSGDDSVCTFSIHGEKNFPVRKFPSTIDVELPDRTEDAAYLTALAEGLDLAMTYGPFNLAIYLAGADPYEHDRLGRLSLTKAGLAARDTLVVETLRRIHNIPVAIAMAGGYAADVNDIVDIHYQTVAIAANYLDN